MLRPQTTDTQQFGPLHQAAKLDPLRIVRSSDRNDAVAATIGIERRDARHRIAHRLQRHAAIGVVTDDRFRQSEHAIDHGGIDILPHPRPACLPERRHRAEGREQTGHRIAGSATNLDRVIGVRAGDAHPAAHRLRDDIEGRPAHVRAAAACNVAEAADRRVDEPRILSFQGVVPEPQLLHRAGAVILDQRVRAAHKLAHERDALWILEIDGGRPLVAVARLEQAAEVPRLVVIAPGSDFAKEVAFQRLDLDDFRTVVGEHLRAKWPGKRVSHVDNPQTRERARIVCHHCLTRSARIIINRLVR